MRNLSSATVLSAAVLLLTAAGLRAEDDFRHQAADHHTQQLSLRYDGSVTIDNPVGSVTVTGTTLPDMLIVAERVIRAADPDAMKQGRANVRLMIEGDETSRTIRSIQPAADPSRKWAAQFNYNIRVPHSVHVNLITGNGQRIRVTNIGGTVRIKNVTGEVSVIAPRGPLVVESINGNVRVAYLGSPGGHARVSSVNGDVQISVPAQSTFRWTAATLRGEFLSTLPVAGRFVRVESGRQYDAVAGSVTAASAHVRASSVTGRVFLLRSGTHIREAVALREGGGVAPSTQIASGAPAHASGAFPLPRLDSLLVQPPAARTFTVHEPEVNGPLNVPPGIGNVFAGDVSGGVTILGRAGEVVLLNVAGDCRIESRGGPINIGDVGGSLDASTRAGDVMVRSARKGGNLSTDGGNVQVATAGGPVRMRSEGGDLILRQAHGPVEAYTRSGDINVRIVDQVRSQRVDLRSDGGTVLLVVPAGFAADLEVMVVTSPGGAQEFLSEFPGLTVTREMVGDRVRIRASGKINGGGERVKLHADRGHVLLRRSVPVGPAPR